MQTKKFLVVLIIIFSAVSTNCFANSFTKSEWKDKVAGSTTEQNDKRLQEIKDRMDQIKSMDKSQLTKEDRKKIKTELKDMRNEVRARSNGIYISLGTLIIIILLLIIIL